MFASFTLTHHVLIRTHHSRTPVTQVGHPCVFQLLKRGRTSIVPTIMSGPSSLPSPAQASTAAPSEAGIVQSRTPVGSGTDTDTAGSAAGAAQASESNAAKTTGTETAAGSDKHTDIETAASTAAKPKRNRQSNKHASHSSPPVLKAAGAVAGVPQQQNGPLAANCFAKFAVVGLSGVFILCAP